MSSKKIYKPRPISGFPEWLPEVRRVEQQWLDHIRKVFESYGYCSIETPAVEELDVIAAKGEDVDKEIYVLERLHKQEGDKDARLALHFDQTVPLARYVAQNFNDLVFPFKRYQMQKVWRGERPQMGRMREFYQCDIDVINVDHLPLAFDAEVAAVMYEVLEGLNVGRVQLRISNRKILLGLLQALKIEDSVAVTRFIDKLEKIGKEEVGRILKSELNLNDDQVRDILDLAGAKDLNAIKPQNDMMREGLEELSFIMAQLAHLPKDAARADLSIVRGLDYYTGTVYETQLLDVPEFTGSVCSGGRYDDLAGSYINRHLPGVGISIGFTRLFDVIRQTERLKVGAQSPAHILVLMLDEAQRAAAYAKARSLREMGLNVETFQVPSKIAKQFAYAEKKGIPYTYIPMDDAASLWEVKDMQARVQKSEDEALPEVKKQCA